MPGRAKNRGMDARVLFGDHPLPMWVYDCRTLAFLAVNDAAIRQYGYSRREFLARTIKDIRPEEDVPALLAKVAHPAEGLDRAGIWRHRKKDGTVIEVEIVTHPIRFGGRAARLVLASDVTERRRLERALAATADDWRKTFDAMSDAVALMDPQGVISRCNKAMAALVGREFPDIVGRRCSEVVHGTTERVAGCPVEEMLATGKRVVATLPVGSRIFRVTADPLNDAADRFVGALLIMADVTEREHAERILQDLVLQQEAILGNIPDIAWLKDERGRFLAVNEAFGKASGHAPGDLVGKTDLEIWPRELAERYRADDDEVMRSGARKIVEEPLVDREGKSAWIETIKTPIRDAAGQVTGTAGIARDITARRRAEEDLRRKEQMLSAAQRIAHIGSWEADFTTGRVFWSEEMHRIYGTAPGTFVPTIRFYLRMIHPGDRRAMAGWIRAASAGERLEKLEFRIFRPDGAERWLRGSIEPLRGGAGEPVGAIGTGQDITESKRAEEVLRISEEKFRTFFDSANDAIFILDFDGRFIDANRVAHERLGYTREELLSKTVAEIDTPEFTARVPERIERIRSHGQAVFESAHVAKDGSVMPVEINSRVLDHGGRKVLYSVVRDISARKVAEDEIRAAKDLLQALSSVQSQFIVETPPAAIFRNLLDSILALTRSAYGFIGEVLHDDAGRPYLRTYAISDIAWNEETRALYDRHAPNFEFRRLDNLFGAVLTTGKPVVANDPEGDPRRGGLPPGHPALVSFLGLPFFHGDTLIGMVGIANRPGGYDEKLAGYLQPLLATSGSIVAAYRSEARREQAEKAVAESEERYRDLFDNANDMIQSVAPDGRFLYVNAAWRRVLGYSDDELRSLSLFDVIHPESRGTCEECFAKVLGGEPVDFIEAKFVARDGRVVEVEGSASVRRQGGRVVSTQAIFRDVSERRRLQEELHRISRDWEDTFNTITDMVTVHDRDFTIIRANRAAERILGLPFLQAKPVKCYEYYHGTGCPPEGCPSCASLDTGTPTVSEIYEPHLGREIEIRAIPRRDSSGRIEGLIHVVRDITERKQAEESERERMRLAEFGMHVGTALVGEGRLPEILGACTQYMVDDLGAAFARIWTVTPDERALVLQASSGIYTHRDGAHGRIPLDSALKIPTIARTRRPHFTNAVIGDPQVDQAWAAREGMVAFAGYPLQVGARLIGVLGLFSRRELSDFTFNALESVANSIASGIERIQSEEALKRYSEELSALSGASNDLLALVSLPGIFDGICRIAEKLFGVELVWLGLIDADAGGAVSIAGRAGAGVEYLRTLTVTLDDAPTGRGPTARAIRSMQPEPARRDSPEFAPWRDAAESCGFEASLAVPLLSPSEAGTCIGALNFYSRSPEYFTPDRIRLCRIFANQAASVIENARLIAGLEEKIAVRTREYESANRELQHLNRELELRRIEAESASRTKSDFLANMSHELRTPLNAIIGFSDLMARDMAGPLTAKQKEYLGDIGFGGRHLLSLINDILDLSKVEAGKMEIEPAEYDPALLVDRSLALFREKALKHRIDLRAELEGPVEPVVGDERKVRQVLYNLLSNAMKFTPDGGSVTLRARTVRGIGEDCAEFSVADTGIGISAGDQKRLFQPFSQLSHHLTKEHEGTGLGLALSKSFVEMHGGCIRVESAPGRGSTFTFTVPLRFAKGRP